MVEELVSRECNVTVFDIDVAGFDELQKAGVRCVACDVTNYEQVNAAVEEFNGVPDVLINNAGILYSEPLIRITEDGLKLHAYESWDRVLRTNLNSVFYMTAPVVAKMVTTRTKGVVVNIGSVSAAGNPGASAYSAAKAAVHALTQAWAKELGPMGIRVIAIAPGFMDTDSAHASTSEAALRETIKRVPLRRLGKAEEVAAAVVAAIENDFFNGKVFELDGGLIV
jgi:3-oxoacyl-[acyl-carrier protein] reductase